MRSRVAWSLWVAVTVVLTSAIASRLQSTDRSLFLPGETTSGHYQIELSCESCHTSFGGVLQQACIQCHGVELEIAEDSHPKAKFTDPRNADRAAKLDATLCVTCHVEHRPAITRAMAVTQPDDYCFLCHSSIGEERVSHAGMAFDTCAFAGCHNFHDNRALYEDFLFKNTDGADLLDSPRLMARSSMTPHGPALAAADADAPHELLKAGNRHDLTATSHARAGVNCSGCHLAADAETWVASPGYDSCATCHEDEMTGFLAGKHGMRLAAKLSPMSPAMARLPMQHEAKNRTLSCGSCHGPHDFDTRRAAVDACLECHADSHSKAYPSSPHFRVWQDELEGSVPAGSGVTCATCHLPREVHQASGATVVRVQHNQNWNLRPNEKMIRDVCMNCHSLSFSIDALADAALIQTNFTGRPSHHVQSMDMVRKRAAATKR